MMNSLKRRINNAVEVYQTGGLKRLLNVFKQFLRRKAIDFNLPFVKPRDPNSLYQGKRTDNEKRWKMISSNLELDDKTALDIGCAEGYFTSKLADLGMEVVGIDKDPEKIKIAKILWNDKERVKFYQSELLPKSIDRIPKKDVTLLLTVYHH